MTKEKQDRKADFSLTIDELRPYCKDFSSEELEQARVICLKYKLSPIRRQIHIQKRWTKNGSVISPLVTIDGLRGIAERSEMYQGQVGPFWCGEDGKWSDVWLSDANPLAAKIGVHKGGFKEALYAVAKFEEYKQVDKDKKVTGLWSKMPDLMIAKCAEALALRRAFPDELGGIYIEDEMHHITEQEEEENKHSYVFSMGGEDVPKSPFNNSEDRKKWMIDAKKQIENLEDIDQFDEYLSENGDIFKSLGNYQQKAMNAILQNKKLEIEEREMNRQMEGKL